MKKILFSLFLSAISISVFSQNLDGLIASVSKAESVEYTVVDSTMLQIAQSIQEADKNGVTRKFKEVEIVNLEKCTDGIKDQFRLDVKQLDSNEYVPVADIKHSGNKITILQKKINTGLTTEFVVLISEVPLCVRIKGSFTDNDIDEILQQANFN